MEIKSIRDKVVQLDPARLTADARMHLMANPFDTELLASGAKAKFRPETCTFEGWGYGEGLDVRAYAVPEWREGFFHLAVFRRDGTIAVYLRSQNVEFTPSPVRATLYRGCTTRWMKYWLDRIELQAGEYLGWVDARDPEWGTGRYPMLGEEFMVTKEFNNQEWLDELYWYKQDRRAV